MFLVRFCGKKIIVATIAGSVVNTPSRFFYVVNRPKNVVKI